MVGQMKTLRKDTIRLIQSTKGRFFALVAIVALGVAFFIGVSASFYIMSKNVDKYNDENNLKDITIYSNYGFDYSDVDAVSRLSSISEVETSKFVDVIASDENESFITRIHSYRPNQKLNHFILVEGRLPNNQNEAVAERVTRLGNGFSLGTVVKIMRPEDDLIDYTEVETVTIVGLIDTPVYLNQTKENSTLNNREINTYFYVPESFFLMDYDTEMNILVQGAKSYDSFGKKYENYIAKIVEEIDGLVQTQASHRRNKIRKEAQEKYNDGYRKYESNLKKYEEEIAKGEIELKLAEEKIRVGAQALSDSRKQLQAGQDELNTQKLIGEARLVKARQDLDSGKKELSIKEKEFQLQSTALKEKISEIDSAFNMLEVATQQLLEAQAAYQEIQSGLNTIKTAEENINVLKEGFEKICVFLVAQDESVIAQLIQKDTSNQLKDLIQKLSLSDEMTVSDVRHYFEVQMSEIGTKKKILEQSLMELKDRLQVQQISIDEIDDKINDLEQSKLDLVSKKEQILLGISEGENKLAEGRRKIIEGEKQYHQGEQTFRQETLQAQEKINHGLEELDKNRNILNESIRKLENGKKELNEKRIDGKEKLDQAKADLDKANQDIESLEAGEWTVLTREQHYGSKTYRSTIQQMKAIAAIFPIFFFFVAALVCLTTMTRMIDEQRGQIGILRALGYSRLQCATKYLTYALSATLLGEIIGLCIGLATFPKIIYEAWRMMYQEPAMQLYFPYGLTLMVVVSFSTVMLVTTWFVCMKDMDSVPSTLLRPKVDSSSNRKQLIDFMPCIWSRFSFSHKITVRNMLRSKRRMMMTMFGVAGCTSLLLIGYGIRDSIRTMVDTQFDEIMLNDGFLTFKNDISASTLSLQIEDIKKDPDIEKTLLFGGYSGVALKGKDEVSVSVQVFSSERSLEEFIQLRTRQKHQPIKLQNEGVIISEKLSELLNVKKGDSIRLESENQVVKDVVIQDICEMYIQHYVFMTQQVYEKVFGVSLPERMALLKVKPDINILQLQERLSMGDGVEAVSLNHSTAAYFKSMVRSLNLIVWVLIISSMSLAFVVLGNLINVNISERKREIATLKVLGFRKKEIQGYIFRENNLLVFFGAIFGIPIGLTIHQYIMRQVEMEYVMFGRNIALQSVVICIILTLIFGRIVNYSMRRKLTDIEMVESLKSVE